MSITTHVPLESPPEYIISYFCSTLRALILSIISTEISLKSQIPTMAGEKLQIHGF